MNARAPRTGPATAEPEQPAAPRDPIDALARKVELAVLATNDRSVEARARYLSWVDRNSGPTGKERNVYGIYRLNADQATRCVDAAVKFRQQWPTLTEFEDTLEGYCTQYANLVPLVDEASDYYDAEGYRLDGWAKGRALHAGMLGALDVLATQRFEIVDQIVEQSLKVLEGRRDRAHAEQDVAQENAFDALLKADRLLYVARQSGPSSAATVDQAWFQKAFAELTTAAARVESAPPTRDFHRHLTAFLVEAQAFGERAKKGKPYSADERDYLQHGWFKVPGSVRNMNEAYEKLIAEQHELIGHELLVVPPWPRDVAAGSEGASDRTAPQKESAAAKKPPKPTEKYAWEVAHRLRKLNYVHCFKQDLTPANHGRFPYVYEVFYTVAGSKVSVTEVRGEPTTKDRLQWNGSRRGDPVTDADVAKVAEAVHTCINAAAKKVELPSSSVAGRFSVRLTGVDLLSVKVR